MLKYIRITSYLCTSIMLLIKKYYDIPIYVYNNKTINGRMIMKASAM